MSGPPSPAVLIGSVLNVPFCDATWFFRSVALTRIVYVVSGSSPKNDAVRFGENAEIETFLVCELVSPPPVAGAAVCLVT